MYTKFGDSHFSHFKDINAGIELLKMGHVTVTTVCHPSIRTWYNLYACKIWWLYLQLFQTYHWGPKLKRVTWPRTLTKPLLRVINNPYLGLDIAYPCTKSDCSSFTFQRYGWCHQNLNGLSDLTMPLSGMVCHPWASTCYGQPIYLISSLYIHPLIRYKWRYKMSKKGWFGVVMVHSRSPEITPFDRVHGSSY